MHFADDGQCQWAGMGNYKLISPNGRHSIDLVYEGEPPHGDSYHKAVIDGRPFPGLVWGCLFAFSSCSRYVAFSWMPETIQRYTMVVDLENRLHFVLPSYIYEFQIAWPSIIGKGLSAGATYTFDGREGWLVF